MSHLIFSTMWLQGHSSSRDRRLELLSDARAKIDFAAARFPMSTRGEFEEPRTNDRVGGRGEEQES